MKETKGTPKKKVSISEKVLHLAFELSQNKWKLAFSNGEKIRTVAVAARHLEQVQEEIAKA